MIISAGSFIQPSGIDFRRVKVFFSGNIAHLIPEIPDQLNGSFCKPKGSAFFPSQRIMFADFNINFAQSVINGLKLKAKLIMLFKRETGFLFSHFKVLSRFFIKTNSFSLSQDQPENKAGLSK